MSVVSDILNIYLPNTRKQTPSGWISFNAPCCVYNGENVDKRGRGGIIYQEEVISYHCFNCNFKTSWQPGRPLSAKMRKLMEWLNIPNDVINKTALEVLQLNQGVEVKTRTIQLPEFTTVSLPEDAVRIQDIPDYNENCLSFEKFLQVIEYMVKRNLNLDDTDYYWSPNFAYRDRLIIPFYYQGKIVGWTARSVVTDKNPKYLTHSQPGYVYNLDEQTHEKLFCIIVEGAIDAIHVDGVAILKNEVNEQQAQLINRLNKDVILLPDRDKAGSKIIEQAIEQGWQVSMPDWKNNIKDASNAVEEYGKLYTIYSIVSAAESSPLKIRLKAKKWFG